MQGLDINSGPDSTYGPNDSNFNSDQPYVNYDGNPVDDPSNNNNNNNNNNTYVNTNINNNTNNELPNPPTDNNSQVAAWYDTDL
jgi:hypothetical protein